MLDLDDDDLIGGAPLPKPARRRPSTGNRVGRPTREERDARLAERAKQTNDGLIALPDVSMFYQPVGVKFLAEVFRMEQRTVLKKLMTCPVVGFVNERGRTVPKWDFKQAAAYLIDPKIDIEAWIRSQRTQDLPYHIAEPFWKAMRSKQAWEAVAKHTWRDEDVLKVLGDTAQLIRDVTLLWVDELPDKASITTENYHALRANVTDLLKQIQEALVEVPKQRRTESTVRSLDEFIQEQDNEALGLVIESDVVDDDEDVIG